MEGANSMASMEDSNLIPSIIELARDAQIKQTKEVLLLIKDLTETPEIIELKTRLRIADEKINRQCDFVLKLDRLVRKYA